jgi:hypothetical protein
MNKCTSRAALCNWMGLPETKQPTGLLLFTSGPATLLEHLAVRVCQSVTVSERF